VVFIGVYFFITELIKKITYLEKEKSNLIETQHTQLKISFIDNSTIKRRKNYS
jgi:hypothetical protein